MAKKGNQNASQKDPAAPYAAGSSCEGEPPRAASRRKRAGGQGARNKELGRRGEEAAANFLERRGFTILERNWTCFAGEADIIASDGEVLVFAEVKTRRGIRKGFPSEAVNAAKRERYERIARAYVQDHFYGEISVRFDVISIVVMDSGQAMVRHHLNAFCAE